MTTKKQRQRLIEGYVPQPSSDQAGSEGAPGGLWWSEESGRLLAANDTPPYPTMKLSDRMGHPRGSWRSTHVSEARHGAPGFVGSNPTSDVKPSDMGHPSLWLGGVGGGGVEVAASSAGASAAALIS